MKLIVPMSGRGQRYIEAGYKAPKPLIEVDGKPMVQHVVELFPGIDDVVFVCNREHLETTNMREILEPMGTIVEIEPHKKGPVYAVSQAYHLIGDDEEVVVSYCDYGTVWDFEGFKDAIHRRDGVIACYRGFHPHMLGGDNYAFCRTDGKRLLEIKEKAPFTDDKMSEWASNGTYYFGSGAILKKYFTELMDLDINLNGEYYVSLVYNLLVRDGLAVDVFEIEKMLQWGTPYDLEVYKGWTDYFSGPDFTLVLPMAGRGQRFRDRGYSTPKPFLEVDGEPMIKRAVDCLPEPRDMVFICMDEDYEDMTHVYPNAEFCTVGETTEGQAQSCELGIQWADIDPESPILISACDNAMVYNQHAFAAMMDDPANDVIVWSFRNNPASKHNPDMYSWLDVDANGVIQHVSCKSFPGGDPLKTHAIIGTMYFRKARYFLEGLQKNYDDDRRTNGEFYVDDVLNRNIEAGLTVKVFEVDNYVCWGTPDDYETYRYWSEHFA